jgi:hypothetical protein
MGNEQPALRALFACESGLSEQEIRLDRSFDLVKEARQMAKFARCSFEKTTANCCNSFCHFHLISPVSRPGRPLIFKYCIFYYVVEFVSYISEYLYKEIETIRLTFFLFISANIEELNLTDPLVIQFATQVYC